MDAHKREQLEQAIEKLRFNVTPADVCRETGLGVDEVTTGLCRIAAASDGTLKVGGNGQILYCFPPAFRSRYASEGFARAVSDAAKQLLRFAHLVLRISFGTILLASLAVLAAIVLALVVIPLLCLAAAGLRSRNFSILTPLIYLCGSFDVISLLFAWNYQAYNPARESDTITMDDAPARPFITNCFSFLFGDSEPNHDFDSTKWTAVAQLIESKNGVVTADDLAPFTLADPADTASMFPVLARFEGRPQVTDSGTIIYTFSKLSACDTTSAPPSFLQEKHWVLSDVGFDGLWPVWFYASINICGWWLVYRFLFSFAVAHGCGLFVEFMLAYAVCFLAIPATRWTVNSFLNSSIDIRNARRFVYSEALSSPSVEMQQKQSECAQYRQDQYRRIQSATKQDTVVYSTDRDLLEQEIEQLDTTEASS